MKVAGQGKVFAYMNDKFWMSIKSAGSAIYANRILLDQYKKYHPNRLATNSANLEGNVYIHSTAKIHASAKIGPHVAIGANAVVGEGARVKNSIILDGAQLKKHCCVLNRFGLNFTRFITNTE